MSGNPSDGLRTLICALDVVCTVISLSTLYIPYFCQHYWTHKKGKVLRRDVWIANVVIILVSFRLVAVVFCLANVIRNFERHTLVFRAILSLTTGPTEWKTLSLARHTKRRVADTRQSTDEEHAQHLELERHINPPASRSQEVLAMRVDGRGWPYRPYKRWGFRKACLYSYLYAIPDTLFVTGLVCTSVALTYTQHSRIWAPVLIWIMPALAVMADQLQRLVRTRRANRQGVSDLNLPKTLDLFPAWTVGTFFGVVVYFIAFAIDYNQRKDQINTKTEAWIQLAEALVGVGG